MRFEMPIVDFTNPNYSLPSDLIFDASILLRYLNNPSLALKSFMGQTANAVLNGHLLAVIPVLTLEECYFKIIQSQYEKATGGGMAWHRLYKNNPNLILNYMPQVQKFRTLV